MNDYTAYMMVMQVQELKLLNDYKNKKISQLEYTQITNEQLKHLDTLKWQQ